MSMLQQISRSPRTPLPPGLPVAVATMRWNIWESNVLADPQVCAYDARNMPIDGLQVHRTFKQTADKHASLSLDPSAGVTTIQLATLPAEVASVHFESVIFGGAHRGLVFGPVSASIEISTDNYVVLVQSGYNGGHYSHSLPFGSLFREADGSWSFASALDLLAV